MILEFIFVTILTVGGVLTIVSAKKVAKQNMTSPIKLLKVAEKCVERLAVKYRVTGLVFLILGIVVFSLGKGR